MALVTISDTLHNALGDLAQGGATITWPSFIAADATVVVAGGTSTTIVDGVLDVSLVATVGATPTGVTYLVEYSIEGNGGTNSPIQFWDVPTGGPYTVAQVEVNAPPTLGLQVALSQLAQDGATSGQIIAWDGTDWAPATPSGGAGSVTSVAATGGVETVTGSPITATGTVRGALPINAQTGTTYTVLTGDRGKQLTFSNAGAVAVTLPQAGVNFPNGWWCVAKNIGAGTVTITPSSSLISGAASIVLATGEWALITSTGSAYEANTTHLIAGTDITLTKTRTGITIDGTAVSGGAYSQSFVGQSSVTVTHGLGTINVTATAYDGSEVIIPWDATHYYTVTNANQIAVVFPGATTGRVVVTTGSSAGGSAGGTNGQIQYNNSSALGGFTASGDATINTSTGAVTLANTAVTPATYGDGTHTAQVTIDSKGRITSASNVPVSGGGGSPGGSASEYQYRAGSSTFGGATNTGPVPTASWVLHNAGSGGSAARGTLDDFSALGVSLNVTGNTTANETCLATQTLGSAPYTVIAQIRINAFPPQALGQAAGLYLYDGTKAYGICLSYVNSAQVQISTNQLATLSTSYPLTGATQYLVGPQVTLKIVDNSTTRKWYYWANGAFVQLLSETTATFLTPTAVGFGANNSIAAAANTEVELRYWSVT